VSDLSTTLPIVLGWGQWMTSGDLMFYYKESITYQKLQFLLKKRQKINAMSAL
jgi:hypothetical protein